MNITQDEAQLLLQIINRQQFSPQEYEQAIRPLIVKLSTPEAGVKEAKKS